MPSGLVHHQYRMPAWRHGLTDYFQMMCHRLGYWHRAAKSSCRLALRAHGAINIHRLRLRLEGEPATVSVFNDGGLNGEGSRAVAGPLWKAPSLPAGMSPAAAEIWQNITCSLLAEFFQPGDLPLLQAYCAATDRKNQIECPVDRDRPRRDGGSTADLLFH